MPSKTLLDTVILDTAGRLHIAEMPMDELKQIDRLVKPDDVLFVCDAMTGQDAVNSAKAFNDALDLNGVILTKLDGDARGGAALSIKEVTKVPIKFVGVGEKLDALRGVPSRTHGPAHPGPGRHHGHHREGAAGPGRADREEEIAGPAREAGQGRLQPRRLPQAVRADGQDGRHEGNDEA